MTVAAVSENYSARAPLQGRHESQMNEDDFVKLFLKQLQMQDPLKPNDTAQMLQQMSALSTMQSTKDLQNTIRQLTNNLGKSQMLSASLLIGHTVAVKSNTAQLIDDKGMDGSVMVPKGATGAQVTIKDENGNVLKTIDLGDQSGGLVDFHWDGKDETGQAVKAGFYQIEAKANYQGASTALPTAGIFKIDSVAFDGQSGSSILNVEGLGGISMDEVIKIL